MSRLGLISDSHDNLEKVRAAVAIFKKLDLDGVIHCGDVVAPFVLPEFKQLGSPLWAVFGNCDGDREMLKRRANEMGFVIADGPMEINFEDKRLVVTHQPMNEVPHCDFYIYGHTHRPVYSVGNPVIINPGEAGGWITGKSTVAVLDTATGRVEFINL